MKSAQITKFCNWNQLKQIVREFILKMAVENWYLTKRKKNVGFLEMQTMAITLQPIT